MSGERTPMLIENDLDDDIKRDYRGSGVMVIDLLSTRVRRDAVQDKEHPDKKLDPRRELKALEKNNIIRRHCSDMLSRFYPAWCVRMEVIQQPECRWIYDYVKKRSH